MSRQKYTITASDVEHASKYLSSKLQTFAIHLRDDASYRTSTKEFDVAIELRGKEERASRLNAWCERYLPSKEWTKLKTSIRKRRERKLKGKERTTVTISTKAFELLKKLSMRDNVTLSKTLEHYLGKALGAKGRRV